MMAQVIRGFLHSLKTNAEVVALVRAQNGNLEVPVNLTAEKEYPAIKI
jgi:hypothetical protein